MPSPENNLEPNRELADDALIGPSLSPTPESGRKRRIWLWALLALPVAIPVGLTLASALTSPPHVKGVPAGQIVYLEADAPSEHTTTLRGLYQAGPSGPPRLLTREDEPQDTDGGIREWITQPAISPDGTQVAYEKQLITLVEEKQSIVNQIWVQPTAPDSLKKPRLVLDLTAQKRKQAVGLAWDSDASLLLLEDGISYSVPIDSSDPPLAAPLDLQGLSSAATLEVSATRHPALTEAGAFAYSVQTLHGPQVVIRTAGRTELGPAADVFALAPTGGKVAYVPPGTSHIIRLYDIAGHTDGAEINARWGWSVFGKRKITSLRWSPDGSQIAYTVSKPPVPDDEIFVVDIAGNTTVQLPYRTGPSAWDWGK